MNAQDIINKRRELWEANRDMELDAEYVNSVAVYISSAENTEVRQEIRKNPELIIEMTFTIVDKEQQTIPFFLNEAQEELINILNIAISEYTNNKRFNLSFLVLKGRQQGFTSIITAYQLASSIVKKNFAGYTIADDGDNSETIFTDKAKHVYDSLPELLKPTELYNNRRELHFSELNSRWRVTTAGNKNAGRSKTLNFFHGSEAGFWDNLKHVLTGLKAALTKDSIQILESTANGHNEFKDLWDEDNNWQCLFFAWWITKEYRHEFSSKETMYTFKKEVMAERSAEEDADSINWIYNKCKWLIKFIGLELEQVYWYYNQWKDYRGDIRQEFPCSAEESFIASGKSIFAKEKVITRIEQLKKANAKVKQGYFEYEYTREPIKQSTEDLGYSNDIILDHTIRWVDKAGGYITIYEDVRARHPYVIGGDTAGEGSDNFAGQVIDNANGKQVAVLKHQFDEGLYTRQMYCLGKYYNDALIAIEANYSRYPIKELKRLGYPKQYVRETEDKIEHVFDAKFGFNTTSITRPIIIANLVDITRESIESFNDLETLQEMLTFVKNDLGKPEAQSGKHDDLVLSIAIAYYVRGQQDYKVRIKEEPKEDKLIDSIKPKKKIRM